VISIMASWCHGKSGKQIERRVITSFQIAESMGFKGDIVYGNTFC